MYRGMGRVEKCGVGMEMCVGAWVRGDVGKCVVGGDVGNCWGRCVLEV